MWAEVMRSVDIAGHACPCGVDGTTLDGRNRMESKGRQRVVLLQMIIMVTEVCCIYVGIII